MFAALVPAMVNRNSLPKAMAINQIAASAAMIVALAGMGAVFLASVTGLLMQVLTPRRCVAPVC